MFLFLLFSYFLSALLLAVLAFLLYKYKLSYSVVSASVMGIYIAVNFITGFLAGKVKKKKKYLWGLLHGGCYFVILLLLSVCFKGSGPQMNQGLLLTMVLCMASGMLGGMLG